MKPTRRPFPSRPSKGARTAPGGVARRGLLAGAAAFLTFGTVDVAAAQAVFRPGRRRRRIMERLRRRGPQFRERAVRARRNGDLRPLRELNARLRKGGFELLDADVFETAHGWVYDIRIIGPAGRVRDVLIDGRTLRRLPDSAIAPE